MARDFKDMKNYIWDEMATNWDEKATIWDEKAHFWTISTLQNILWDEMATLGTKCPTLKIFLGRNGP